METDLEIDIDMDIGPGPFEYDMVVPHQFQIVLKKFTFTYKPS
jgi:hypothetical protein